ncbi:glucose 1-dehydrogenase [Halieaceae bacterium IMCC14734]|uniref:Glucose 1-dehydrogenase n=1 Tax=Candidatus Litorirhabdus singularis TaxID=2518993 RepID=A0ABT3TC62_9GAMM|nr:glucose 1-dehydrogenase [Candidatus Litorirhabdus singularis]MCX2979881.1 glucose 1-dehydrogenase [Candidatus Litorirhabdus singularis]
MARVEGKVAIVTGGAQGLGEAAVKGLTREGALVLLCDTNAARGAETATKYGAKFYQHDVGEEDQWRALMDNVVAQYGRLDILVNNAGIFHSSRVDETSLEDFRRVIDINLTGCFLGCKHGVQAMRANPDSGGGSIINLSSVSGQRGQAGNGAYGSSKAAVALLTKTVAVENGEFKIRCNSIHPGIIQTPMLDALFEAAGDQAAAITNQIEQKTPLGIIGNPDDIGDMVVFLASTDSQFITGAEMVVDGGAIASLPY